MSEQSKDLVYFLLVDDREPNLVALEQLLRRDGLVLLKARSGVEALELLLQHEVALALIDIQMPGMDGFELAESMRGTERTRRVPIIFLTAASTDQQRHFRGYEAGAVDFLQKPLEPDILRSKTGVFFELYRQRQEVARHRDELAQMIEENSRLLRESRQYALALQDADRRKDEFLAMLAHELRNPLAPVRSGLELLALSGVEHESIPLMREQVEHLVRLVDDLLDVARIMQGKIALRLETVDLLSLAQKAVDTVRPALAAHAHRLSTSFPEETVWVNGDSVRLAQIIVNLLNNAVKYTEPGGQIWLTIDREGDEIRFSVRDDGIGLDEDLLPKVFDLFIQADRSLERSEGGLGIGLTLVKTLVTLHGGNVTAHSEGVGRGSEFVVTLPAHAPPGADRATEAAVNVGSRRRILIVDDNVGTTKIQAMLLARLGDHEIRTAHNGVAALEIAAAFRPDIILLDIGLPQMSGYDVARRLRQRSELDGALLVALTGYGTAEDRRRSLDAGFDMHLVKPPSLDSLRRILAEPLGRRSRN